jgi:hypothetical protein
LRESKSIVKFRLKFFLCFKTREPGFAAQHVEPYDAMAVAVGLPHRESSLGKASGSKHVDR